ncbi:SusD family protein [Soonwooa buanensis]|uniref:SusD family protein n=1 Tax=Soonwooa buanensis TaxID=619805 RepID=A0A1T5ECH3_9FLAO|nr:RagB/SusD family nutrient uptake outer membrane protein [Soonwooa buanensis]SKB81509.1 SusD family protein [Soonwooa buanensis]
MNKTIKIGILSLIVGLGAVSCSDDFVEREFHQQVEQGPLKTVNEMQAFVMGGYASMRSPYYYGADFLAYGEVRSDEMISNLAGGYYTNVFNYTMLSNDPYATNTYNKIYELVAKANIVINTDVKTLSGSDLDREDALFYQGQAYGLRAIAFFDALRLYGQKYIPDGTGLGVVLPLKYDPKALQPRATIAQTEAQIEADFAKAIELMDGGQTGVTELSTNALKAMMSRFYLYKGDYAKVRSLSNDLLGKYTVVASNTLQTSFRFVMNGAAPNSIFELAVGLNASLSTSSYRHRLNPYGYGNIVVNASTANLYADNDARKTLITANGGQRYLSFGNTAAGSFGKYTQPQGADNIKMIRYEEILLNAVEAELKGGDATKALEYYKNLIANRLLPIAKKDADGNPVLDAAGNPVMVSGEEQANAITSVDISMLKKERMKELLGEGLRQWDLRRWGDAVPRPEGAAIGKDPNHAAFPIPRTETDIANTPVLPNPGYDNSK